MRIAIVAVVLFCEASAVANVQEFVETFRGEGDFDSVPDWGIHRGLDNPGWRIGLADGGVTPNGLQIQTESATSEFGITGSTVVREKEGTGSFVERIVLREVELTASNRSVSEINFGHFMIGFPVEKNALAFTLREVGPSSEDPFEWAANGKTVLGNDRMVHFGELVPASEDAEMAIELRYNDRSRVTFFAYDINLGDDIPTVQHGPFPYTGEVADSQSSYLFLSAGGHSTANVVVSEWSLRPVDDFDFSMDGSFNMADVDMLSSAVRSGEYSLFYDVSEDSEIDSADLVRWVSDVAGTYIGDANFDGEFNSGDLVHVFNAGEYTDDIAGNSTWSTGDWNADGEFTSNDLVAAFQAGGYGQGPREETNTVPEPTSLLVWMLAWMTVTIRQLRCRAATTASSFVRLNAK